ncbi:MAG: NAD(+) kinase [Candidatus Marinimicrobia bacterium]|nr:NAD(+) kinase [Candidatus Neomarinimicrobiota bacterium]
MIHPKKFGIWGNTDKRIFWKTLPKILDWSRKKGIKAHFTERILFGATKKNYNQPIIHSKEDIGQLDFMLVLGGDGTFLSCARAVGKQNTPILGIHLGDLGFLAKVTLDNIFQRLDQVAIGDYTIEKRALAKALVKIDGDEKEYIGLNDFVVKNNESHRMLNCRVQINDHLVSIYKSDGLIVATPTGSTAYSLSSSGPIITPDVDSFVVTAISPHSLTSRPLVISANSKVFIDFPNEENNITFTTDGQIHETLDATSSIQITRADFRIGLIDFIGNDYFQTLRAKMDWGKRGEN